MSGASKDLTDAKESVTKLEAEKEKLQEVIDNINTKLRTLLNTTEGLRENPITGELEYKGNDTDIKRAFTHLTKLGQDLDV